LKDGYRADVAIVDPENFCDRATDADPHQFPSGARTSAIVNGTIVVENAAHTGRCRARCCGATARVPWPRDWAHNPVTQYRELSVRDGEWATPAPLPKLSMPGAS
jgi:hypothetical protein